MGDWLAKLNGFPGLYSQPHERFCADLEEAHELNRPKMPGQKYFIFLEPRHTLKTTVGTVDLAIEILAIDPNARILIDSHKQEFSQQILREIKGNLQRPAFIDLFGDWRLGASEWSESAITIGPRTAVFKEPSIDTSGVDASKTGGHYDHILLDDVHNEKNSESEVGRERAYQHIFDNLPILAPDGCYSIRGTRWEMRDAYGRCLRDDARAAEEGEGRMWKISVHRAHNPDGTLYCPDILTAEFLTRLKRRLPPRRYACWYDNQPIEDESVFFPLGRRKVKDIKFYLKDYIRPVIRISEVGAEAYGEEIPVYVIVCHDPAVSRAERADFNGIIVVAFDAELNWYVLEARRVVGPDESLRQLVALIRVYHPQRYSYEKIGVGWPFARMLRERCANSGVLCPPIHEYSGKTALGERRKRARIEVLQPIEADGKLVIAAERCLPLLEEMENYPQVDHEDCLDSLAQADEIKRKPDPIQLVPGVGDEDEETRERVSTMTKPPLRTPQLGLGTTAYKEI